MVPCATHYTKNKYHDTREPRAMLSHFSISYSKTATTAASHEHTLCTDAPGRNTCRRG